LANRHSLMAEAGVAVHHVTVNSAVAVPNRQEASAAAVLSRQVVSAAVALNRQVSLALAVKQPVKRDWVAMDPEVSWANTRKVLVAAIVGIRTMHNRWAEKTLEAPPEVSLINPPQAAAWQASTIRWRDGPRVPKLVDRKLALKKATAIAGMVKWILETVAAARRMNWDRLDRPGRDFNQAQQRWLAEDRLAPKSADPLEPLALRP
jgi:hypothetical protein